MDIYPLRVLKPHSNSSKLQLHVGKQSKAEYATNDASNETI